MLERRLIVVAMLAALGGACEKKGGSLGPDKNLPAELQPTRASFDPSKVVVPALFGYVPADTPYVLGGFEAVGLDYYAKLKQGLGPSFGKMLTSARAQGDDEAMRLFDVIYEELGGKLDANSLEHLGLSAKPRFVVYGLGVVPAVARLEIKDETALRATLDRVATKLGEQLPPQENRGGKAYWRFTEDDVTGIVAILDNQLVGAIGPTASVEAKLDLILGIQKPAQSMADGKALIDVMQKHGFGPHLVGYLDTRKLGAQGLSLSDQPPPATCAPAVDQLAAKVPRIVMGYTEISGKRASGGAVIELEPGLLAELAALRTQVPGLGTALSDQPLLAFGGGVDIAKGAALLARAASAVRTTAEACNVPDLVEVAADAFDTLSQPLPPPATKITGFAAALHAFDMGDTGIKKLDGFGMVTASSAKELIALVKDDVPLDQIGLPMDGKLGKLNVPAGILPFEVVGGVGDKAIVVATGDKGRALAERGLRGSATGPSPFMVATYDYGRMLELQAKLAAMGLSDQSDAEAEMNKGLASVFGRANFSVDTTDKGLVMWGAFDLK